MKTKIAIACQGGGSHAAFTAGALQALFEADIQDKYEIVSLSGTSGGALNAILAWYALKKGEKNVEKRLADFWLDNTAQSPQEQFFNDFAIKNLEYTSKGLLPQFNVAPTSMLLKNWMKLATFGLRSRFTNFQELLETHIDFQEIASWGPQPEGPILLLGASNIRTGKLWMFNSSHEVIKVEHVLASCAIPNLFPAVEIGPDAYWDGIFSDNPPITELLDPNDVGRNIPQEIWVIKLNPTRRENIPIEIDDILDRRNELEGNISLFQSLRSVERLNDLLLQGAYKEEFLERMGIREPVKIPRSFIDLEDKPYYIPFIEMSPDLQNSLNYESKLDRNPKSINRLIEDGKQQAKHFLAARSAQ
jgi:NTE family protein